MSIAHTFTVRIPYAQQVNVIGDFNNWQTTATELNPIGDDLWQVTVHLKAGKYQYAYFVIDSRWNDASAVGVSRTRVAGQGSWAHVTDESWQNASRPIHLSPTQQQLNAA